MVELKEVSEEEAKALKERKQYGGRISGSIFKQFEESGMDMARIDTERNPGSLVQLLRMQIKDKHLPYRIVTSKGRIYIMKVKPASEVKDIKVEDVGKL